MATGPLTSDALSADLRSLVGHEHLYSEEWAGFDLASVSPDPGSRATIVHHLKISALPA